MRKISRIGKHKEFFLRHGESEIDQYNRSARFMSKFRRPAFIGAPDSEEDLRADRELVLREAREATHNHDLSLLACAEDHAGASAADHSNFAIVCRRLIMEAEQEDLEQFYVSESHHRPCRVTSILADIRSLSGAMRDEYLDRHKWLTKSWPLNNAHHADALANRLVSSRSRYVTDLLQECGEAARMAPAAILSMQSRWMLAAPSAKYAFAQRLVSILSEGLQFFLNGAETFSADVVKRRGHEVIRNYSKVLR